MDCCDPSALITKMTYTSHQIRVNIKSMNKDEHLKVCFDFFSSYTCYTSDHGITIQHFG